MHFDHSVHFIFPTISSSHVLLISDAKTADGLLKDLICNQVDYFNLPSNPETLTLKEKSIGIRGWGSREFGGGVLE